jgi:hypothetical protein
MIALLNKDCKLSEGLTELATTKGAMPVNDPNL